MPKKTQLIDTKENTEVVYLFVNKFDWLLTMDKESNVGHPKPGKVYRAIYNNQTDSYRITYKIGNTYQAVLIPSLVNSDETNGYLSDIRRITKKNILDFEITESDLDQLNQWIDISNKDLLDQMWNSKPKVEVINIDSDEMLAKIMGDFIKDTDPDHTRMLEKMYLLREQNAPVSWVIGYLVEYLLDEPIEESPFDINSLSLDKTHGAGVNISAAIQKLSRYCGSNRRTNMSEEDLLGAIRDLLKEVERRLITD
jgi:hypothetical protein